MKIIVIDHEPFSSRKEHHYFIDSFLQDNIEIEYWAVNKVLSYSKNIDYNDVINKSYVKVFLDYYILLDELKKINRITTFIFIEISFSYETLEIFKCLKNNKLNWGKIDYYLNPTNCLEPQKKLWNRIRYYRKGDLKSLVKNIIIKKYQYLNTPDVSFITGRSLELVNKDKKVVSLNYFDVEIYKNAIKEEPLIEGKYIVFLDIMLVNHPDSQRNRYKEVISSTYYFEKLDVFFNKLEEEYNMPVVIASHPKASYTNEFKSRKCIKNNTANLVINSEFVITHGSLSISYALFSYKPILFFYFGKSFKANYDLYRIILRMNKIKNMISANFIDIEDTYSINKLDSISIDRNSYDNFIKNYYLMASNMNNYLTVKNTIEGIVPFKY